MEQALKKYVQERKLSMAVVDLCGSQTPIIDIAYDYGFEYPEVFSRSFKRYFGMSPKEARGHSTDLRWAKKIRKPAKLIEREFVNKKGQLSVKTSIEERTFNIYGIKTTVDQTSDTSKAKLRTRGTEFINMSRTIHGLKPKKHVSIIKCLGDDAHFEVLFGREAESTDTSEDICKNLILKTIEPTRFAVFTYLNDIYDVEGVFIDDLFRWIAIQDYTLKDMGFGVIFEYQDENPAPVTCWIPIE